VIDAELQLPRQGIAWTPARGLLRTLSSIRIADMRHPHLAPLTVLGLANLVMLRHILFGHGLPAGVDSAFLYSALPYYVGHGLSLFTVWLPGPLGEVQQYSLYWALASVAAVLGHPLAVYKGAMATVVAATSATSYGFAFRMSGDRIASACAALLYSFAPFAIAQWLDGHLNVQIAYAVGPLALWSLSNALRTGRARPAVALGASGAALFLLTTGQGIYWLLPLGLVFVREVLFGPTRGFVAIRRASRTLGIAAAAFLALAAVQLIPYLLGAKAPFVGGGGSYYIEQLSIHEKYSLPFLDGVAGAPREIYLPGTQGVGSAAFAEWQLQILGLVVAGVGIAAIATRRWREALPLAVAAMIAWLLAAGPLGPAGGAYVFLYDHISTLRFLRVPNRWLMVSTLSVSTMTAVTLAEMRRAAPLHARRFVRRAPKRLIAIIVLAMFACGARAFVPGLTTWEPPRAYATAYGSIAHDRTDWRILTTPFFQSWMEGGGTLDNGQAITADLGYTSSYWHHHAVLGRGGWDPRASRFAQYLYELVKQGTTTSLPKLLGAIDVKYVAIDPATAIESVAGQNVFIRRQQGLRRVIAAGGIEIFRNEEAVAPVFEARTACVVAGGLSVLGDLASEPGFEFTRLVPLFADQLVATGGLDALRREIKATQCLVVAPGGLDALHILLTENSSYALADVAPKAWARTQTSPSLDVAADPSISVSAPTGGSFVLRPRIRHGGWRRIWILGLRDRGQPDLEVSVDGRDAMRLSLRASLGAGYRWEATRPVFLIPGHHRITVRVAGVPGSFAQLTRAALTPSDARRTDIGVPSADVVRDEAGATPVSPVALRVLRPLLRTPWHGLGAPTHVEVTRSGSAGAIVHIRRGGRRYFTLATADARAVDPFHAWALRFRGSGDGRTYYLNVVFEGARDQSFGFRFRDTSRRLRTILLSPLQPSFSSLSPDWAHIAGFTFSSSTKRRVGHSLYLSGPFETSVDLRPRFSANAARLLGATWARDTATFAVETRGLRDGVRIPGTVPNGYLVVTQSYNPNWKLHGASAEHIVALGFANGYALRQPARHVELTYGIARIARAATLATGTAWAVALGFLLFPVIRKRRT